MSQENSYYLRRIYRLLENPDVIVHFKPLREPIHGLAYECSDTFVIDPRKTALTTTIHECLHLLYPEYPESKILQLESKIANRMTRRQWRNLLYRVANKL